MWDCPKCGTLQITGLDNCPVCHHGRGEPWPPPEPAEEVPDAKNKSQRAK
jgi:hypothetical protein